MGNEENSLPPRKRPSESSTAPIYEIRVKGCMDQDFWADWFGEMKFTIDLAQSEIRLEGAIDDQAELYGLLSRLRNKGLALISVQQIQQDTNRR